MQLQYQSTTPLAANTVLVPPAPSAGGNQWFNTSLASGNSVRVAVYADQPGILILQQTDDPGFSNMIYEVGRVVVSGKVATKLEYGITAQFWRFVYTNGPTAQTVFNLVAYSGPDLTASVLSALRQLNLQITAMRGQDDSSIDDFSQI